MIYVKKSIIENLFKCTKMNSTARKHHFLTQAYLAAFTDNESKDGQFCVLDLQKEICFRTTPKNVAFERDFNRIDIEGKPLDILEQALAPFEGRAVQAIRNVNQTKNFPNDEDFKYIINLLCLFALRNPLGRKSFDRSRELTWQIVGDLLVSNEMTWACHAKKIQEEGYVKEICITFEEAKKNIEERKYLSRYVHKDIIKFPSEDHIPGEFHTFDKILPKLRQRTWSLFIAPSSGPGFICSDHPVTLTWKNSTNRDPIGYGLNNTQVFFPIGPRTGFFGVYEDPLRPVVNLKPFQVAILNKRVWHSASRQVFSKTNTLSIWDEGELIEVDCCYIYPSSKCSKSKAENGPQKLP